MGLTGEIFPCMKIRVIRTNFTSKAQRISEMQNHEPILWRPHTAGEGFMRNTIVMRKQSVIPVRRRIICSRPDDLTIGVFQNQIKTVPTNTVRINPIMAMIISIIAHGSVGFKYNSSISTQLVLPFTGSLPHIVSGHV